jgi:hypothetical protein
MPPKTNIRVPISADAVPTARRDGAHRLRAGNGADAAHQRHGKEQADQRQHRQLQPGKAA